MRLQTKRVAVATLFGAVIFVSKTLPTPIDKIFIFPQALLLALGALLLQSMGATYVAVIGGVLTALWRPAFAPFSFGFALTYGLLVDAFFFTLKVKIANERVEPNKLIIAITVSTALVGFLSSYVTNFLGLLQVDFIFQITVLIVGTLNGFLAGYFTFAIWNKYLKNVRFN